MKKTDDGKKGGRASETKCLCFPAFYLKGFKYGTCDIDLLEWVKSTLRLQFLPLGGQIIDQSSLILVNIFPVRIANIPTG